MPFWYRIETERAATIREAWSLRSRLPLHPTALEIFAKTGLIPAGVDVTAEEDDTTVEEQPRRVASVAAIRLPDRSPAHDDGV